MSIDSAVGEKKHFIFENEDSNFKLNFFFKSRIFKFENLKRHISVSFQIMEIVFTKCSQNPLQSKAIISSKIKVPT